MGRCPTSPKGRRPGSPYTLQIHHESQGSTCGECSGWTPFGFRFKVEARFTFSFLGMASVKLCMCESGTIESFIAAGLCKPSECQLFDQAGHPCRLEARQSYNGLLDVLLVGPLKETKGSFLRRHPPDLRSKSVLRIFGKSCVEFPC